MYVYTKKGEERAKELGVEPRMAGAQAMFGHEPLYLYEDTAKAWVAKGYVEWKDDD